MLFKSPDGELVRIKSGFSWQAFFIGSLRAMIRRTWFVLAVLGLGYAVVAWMYGSYEFGSGHIALGLVLLAVYFLYMVFCGVYGNRWLVASLLRRGFRQVRKD